MVPVRPSIAVLAHGFADADPLPVSLPLLIAATVGLAVLAAALPPRHGDVVAPLATRIGPRTRAVLRAVVLIVAVAIVVPAAFGPSDVAANPAPRLLFTVGWAGLLLTSALVGGWWREASPLRAFADDGPNEAAPVWVAAGALLVFGVLEQVVEPSPMVALLAVALYALGGVAIAGVRGVGLAGGDPLEVSSGLLGSLAPLGHRDHLRLRNPRRGAAAHPVVPGLGVFLGVMIGINVFDAAEVEGTTVTRLGVYAVVVVVSATVCWAAARPARLAPALIPAAAGHLGAHYLAPLLVDTQIAAVLASDPLARGWNLLGLTGSEIVAEPIPATAGLWVQLILLVAGHALAMAVATDLAGAGLDRRRRGALLFAVRGAILASLVMGVLLRFGGLG